MTHIKDKITEITNEFNQIKDWEDKYKKIITLGRKLDDLSPEYQTEKFRIKGCQSQVWLRPEYSDGKVYFSAASDAVLVKGIISLLVEVYSGASPEEIITTDASFLKEIGISEHLSMNRTNGLASMIKQIQMYAIAYKSLYDKGIMSVPQ